jgi:hypothetical protein
MGGSSPACQKAILGLASCSQPASEAALAGWATLLNGGRSRALSSAKLRRVFRPMDRPLVAGGAKVAKNKLA